MHAFFVQKFVQSQILSREKLLKRLSYEKCVHKRLMKLTPEQFFSTGVPWTPKCATILFPITFTNFWANIEKYRQTIGCTVPAAFWITLGQIKSDNINRMIQ